MADSRRESPATGAHGRASAAVSPNADERSAFDFDMGRRQGGGESIPDLLRELVAQGSHLAEQQTKLVQAEVRSAVHQTTGAVTAMAAAAVVAIAGLGVSLMGVSFLLAKVLPLWAATLIVAIATMALSYTMFATGRRKIEHDSLNFERTRNTLERAPSAISRKASEDQRS